MKRPLKRDLLLPVNVQNPQVRVPPVEDPRLQVRVPPVEDPRLQVRAPPVEDPRLQVKAPPVEGQSLQRRNPPAMTLVPAVAGVQAPAVADRRRRALAHPGLLKDQGAMEKRLAAGELAGPGAR